MDVKEALNYLRVGILQMPYSHVSYDTLVESIELVESKLQLTATPSSTNVKPCVNVECNKNHKNIKRKISGDSSCSIFLKSAVARCLNYKR